MPHEMGDEEDERSYVTPASTKGKPPALTAFTYVYGLVTRARGEEMMVDDRGSYMDDTFAGTKVFVSRSTDAGVTWSSPTQMPGGGDEFNQWLAVDPTDGSVNVAYYDTGTPGAAATVYTLARSTTQGASYSSQAIANAPTDETTGHRSPRRHRPSRLDGQTLRRDHPWPAGRSLHCRAELQITRTNASAGGASSCASTAGASCRKMPRRDSFVQPCSLNQPALERRGGARSMTFRARGVASRGVCGAPSSRACEGKRPWRRPQGRGSGQPPGRPVRGSRSADYRAQAEPLPGSATVSSVSFGRSPSQEPLCQRVVKPVGNVVRSFLFGHIRGLVA
jgi:hypothetical protein